jgi:uncharacterized membrane protein
MRLPKHGFDRGGPRGRPRHPQEVPPRLNPFLVRPFAKSVAYVFSLRRSKPASAHGMPSWGTQRINDLVDDFRNVVTYSR